LSLVGRDRYRSPRTFVWPPGKLCRCFSRPPAHTVHREQPARPHVRHLDTGLIWTRGAHGCRACGVRGCQAGAHTAATPGAQTAATSGAGRLVGSVAQAGRLEWPVAESAGRLVAPVGRFAEPLALLVRLVGSVGRLVESVGRLVGSVGRLVGSVGRLVGSAGRLVGPVHKCCGVGAALG
jgi:hypothetical protein